MARNLWQAMSEIWQLPAVEEMPSTDSEWVLHMLDGKTETERVMIMMTLWRIWYCQNEVIHQKPAPSIESSRRFLSSYLESILTIKQFPNVDPAKGKTVVTWERSKVTRKKRLETHVPPLRPWRKPPEGRVKLNTDGSFCEASGVGGAGMILRDAEGQIIVSACKLLNPCQSPLEAELEACRDGVALALEWSTLPCTVELDSSVAVKMIQSPELDRSLFAGIVQEIKQLLSSRCNMELVCISHIIKGKMVVNPEEMGGAATRRGQAEDGAYSTEAAGTGMALRDHRGEIIYAACRSIPHCGDATKAEIMAIEEGLQLALHWTSLKFTVESDCAEAVDMINGSTPNVLAYAF
ncbi:hypothetical protein QYE76_042825 [Lolium multiflorum]|uniref:RNase H type-1 domain-containing protein n=1 Tax=Lolium multiflorum TaxID=4521 RepID=A0AAD8WV14_LOLMU|nr:hypothetical protein QYE76_042825 [Lolium multiflorum]